MIYGIGASCAIILVDSQTRGIGVLQIAWGYGLFFSTSLTYRHMIRFMETSIDTLVQEQDHGGGFGRKVSEGFPSNLVRVAQRKLFMLDNADELTDLRTPPGNRLEALKDDRTGQHSIRVNGQFRICFRWVEGGAEDVEIADYH